MHDTPERRDTHRRVGDAAEDAAARFLQGRGLVILDRRYLRRLGELDLVFVDPASGCIVFVEVRYRGGGARFGAIASVDSRKRGKLLRTASAWLQRHADPRRQARIDIVGLMPGPTRDRMPGPTASTVRGDRRDDREVTSWEGYRLSWIRNAVGGDGR